MTNYTANQRAAIEEIERNLQIIACAGSGKTQVISARVVEISMEEPGESETTCIEESLSTSIP